VSLFKTEELDKDISSSINNIKAELNNISEDLKNNFEYTKTDKFMNVRAYISGIKIRLNYVEEDKFDKKFKVLMTILNNNEMSKVIIVCDNHNVKKLYENFFKRKINICFVEDSKNDYLNYLPIIFRHASCL
jgi:hypothetical protein